MRWPRMNLFVSALATAATFFAAATAGALVTITTTGVPCGQIAAGDLITLEIVMTASAGSRIQGLGASVHGYGGNARFVGGEAVGNFFNAICVGPGVCFGGLSNLAGTANGAQRTLAQTSIGAFGPRVQFALSASGSPITATGDPEQGLDGEVGTAMFRVTLEVLPSASDFTLFVDTTYQGDLVNLPNGQTEEAVGQSFGFGYCPEPGTALLLGLGLAGLAVTGRPAPFERSGDVVEAIG